MIEGTEQLLSFPETNDYLTHFLKLGSPSSHVLVGSHEDYDSSYNYYYNQPSSYYTSYYSSYYSGYQYSGYDYSNYDSSADWEAFGTTMLYFFVIVAVVVTYFFFMVAGFWLFGPMIVCLVYTGGDLPTCSLNFFDNSGRNGVTRAFDVNGAGGLFSLGT